MSMRDENESLLYNDTRVYGEFISGQPFIFNEPKYLMYRQILLISLFCVCAIFIFILATFLLYCLIRKDRLFFGKKKNRRRPAGMKDFLKSSQCDFTNVTNRSITIPESDYLIKRDDEEDHSFIPDQKYNSLCKPFLGEGRLPTIPETVDDTESKSPSCSSGTHSIYSHGNQNENVMHLRESMILFPSLSTLNASTNSLKKSLSSSNNGSESPDFSKIDDQFKKQSSFSRQSYLKNNLDCALQCNLRKQDSPTMAAEIYEKEYKEQRQEQYRQSSLRQYRSLSFLRSSEDSGSERSVY